MDAKVKHRWINALRGGKYKQAQKALCVVNPKNEEKGFCCLGVLCDLYRTSKANTDKTKWKPLFLSNPARQGASFGGEIGILPEFVKDWAGLDETDPSITISDSIWKKFQKKFQRLEEQREPGETYGFADANDEGFTFKQIADMIEEQL